MSIEQQAKGKKEGDIRYLTPLNIDTNKNKKYCRFKKLGIKYIDYKDPSSFTKILNSLRSSSTNKVRFSLVVSLVLL